MVPGSLIPLEVIVTYIYYRTTEYETYKLEKQF